MIRPEVWPFLLHYFPFDSTFEEREQIRNDKYIEYYNIRKMRWELVLWYSTNPGTVTFISKSESIKKVHRCFKPMSVCGNTHFQWTVVCFVRVFLMAEEKTQPDLTVEE